MPFSYSGVYLRCQKKGSGKLVYLLVSIQKNTNFVDMVARGHYMIKSPKKMISTSKQCVKHPFAGQNTQQICLFKITQNV